MHKKFAINRTKIKGGCQSGRKVVTHNSKSDLPLVVRYLDNIEPNNGYLYLSSNFKTHDIAMYLRPASSRILSMPTYML